MQRTNVYAGSKQQGLKAFSKMLRGEFIPKLTVANIWEAQKRGDHVKIEVEDKRFGPS